MNIVILGLSITSSWGNGHATTYRSLVRGLHSRGHQILFLERDVPWYAGNRDQPSMPEAEIEIYSSLPELFSRFEAQVRNAAVVIVGSFVPEGLAVGEWVIGTARGVTAFYDIDTPVTLHNLENGQSEYLSRNLARRYQLYLSFTGGPILRKIESRLGAPMARALYCSVDPERYYPEEVPPRWDMGYLGTYSRDRQPVIERLMLEPAREWASGRFIVAGPEYPPEIRWPGNVSRIFHLEPKLHRRFYTAQRFTLNVTRSLMVEAGHSPSVRLFEAAACGTPIVSDYWDGLETFFEPGKEILVSRGAEETLRYLREISEPQRRAMGAAALQRALGAHTPAHRAAELESYCQEVQRNEDYVLVSPTRRDGGDREHVKRPPAGSTSQSQWIAAGGSTGSGTPANLAASRLREPVGTHDADSPAFGRDPKSQRHPLRGSE